MIPFSNIVPFIGVVQASDDLSLTGRCKVRCFGFHPPASDPNVPVETLPWAIVLNSSLGGVHSPEPKPGEWVFGFFLDGRDAQFPMILGSIPGHSLGNLNNSWADATAATIKNAIKLASPSHHTGVDTESHPIVGETAALPSDFESLDQDGVWIPDVQHTGSGATSINSSSYNGAHVVASDQHCTMQFRGSVVQIQDDGSIVINSASNLFTGSRGSSVDVSKSTKNIIVEQGNYNIKVNGNCNIEVNGDMKQTVTGDYTIGVGGKFNVVSGEQLELQGAKASLHGTSESVNISAATEMMIGCKNISFSTVKDGQVGPENDRLDTGEIFIKGDNNIYVEAAKNINLTVGGETRMKSTGKIDVQTDKSLTVSSKDAINLSSDTEVNIKSSSSLVNVSTGDISLNTSGTLSMDAALIDMQNNSSKQPGSVSITTTTPDKPEKIGAPAMADLTSALPKRSSSTLGISGGNSGGGGISVTTEGDDISSIEGY